MTVPPSAIMMMTMNGTCQFRQNDFALLSDFGREGRFVIEAPNKED